MIQEHRSKEGAPLSSLKLVDRLPEGYITKLTQPLWTAVTISPVCLLLDMDLGEKHSIIFHYLQVRRNSLFL